jgi:hypothetical protein
MADETTPQKNTSPKAQFGMKGLLLAVLAGCVLLGVSAAMFRDGLNEPPQGFIVLLPVLAPMGLMVVLGLIYVAVQFVSRWRRRSR